MDHLLNRKSASKDKSLLNTWDPGDKKVISGFVYTTFLHLFGFGKKEGFDVIEPWRGPPKFSEGVGVSEESWKEFDGYDRAAVHSARAHRDSVVLVHFLSFLAVFFAVAGSITDASWLSFSFAIFELVVLGAIIILLIKNKNTHQSWLELRQRAEAFRVKALLKPFGDNYEHELAGSEEVSVKNMKSNPLKVCELLLDKEDVTSAKSSSLKEPLSALLDDQVKYHRGTHERWEKTHKSIERYKYGVFIVVLFIVSLHAFSQVIGMSDGHGVLNIIGHWIHEQKWFLLFTAVGPALAAALHGVAGKLEISKVSKQSEDMQNKLQIILDKVNELHHTDLVNLGNMAKETARILSDDHESWRLLFEDQKLDLA